MQKTIKAINIDNFEDDITVQFEQIRLCPHCNVSTNNRRTINFVLFQFLQDTLRE